MRVMEITSNSAIPIVNFTEDSLVYDSVCLQKFAVIDSTRPPTSKTDNEFDRFLKSKWDQQMEKDSFWYNLSEVKRQLITGTYGFIAQLNTKRFEKRRKPESCCNVKEPFPKNKFNFSKIKDSEILFELRNRNSKGGKRNLVVVNVSPIEYGHVLLLPDVDGNHPQLMNTEGIKVALEMCLLSGSRSLRLGFNSLCAYASVNHLHFHAFYMDYELPIDRAIVQPIGNGLYELIDYAVCAFALQLERKDIDGLARKLNEIAWYFTEYNIPHNVFISRNDHFEGPNEEDTVRVYVFPKVPVPGQKDTLHLNSCCFDVAGYLLLKDADEYQQLSQKQALEILNYHTLRQDEFDDLKFNLSILLSKLTI